MDDGVEFAARASDSISREEDMSLRRPERTTVAVSNVRE